MKNPRFGLSQIVMDPDEIRWRIETGQRRQVPQPPPMATASAAGGMHSTPQYTGVANYSTIWLPGFNTQPTQLPPNTQQTMGSQPATAGLFAGPQANHQPPAGTTGNVGPPWYTGCGPYNTWIDAPQFGYSNVSIIPFS